MESIAPFINSSLYDLDPLFQSMETQIKNLHSSSAPIFIPCVEFDFMGRKGFYDFQISIHPENPELRAWLVVDNTSVYKYYQKIQQQRNELLMEKETRSRGFGWHKICLYWSTSISLPVKLPPFLSFLLLPFSYDYLVWTFRMVCNYLYAQVRFRDFIQTHCNKIVNF